VAITFCLDAKSNQKNQVAISQTMNALVMVGLKLAFATQILKQQTDTNTTRVHLRY
jgi:hypothetical protein